MANRVCGKCIHYDVCLLHEDNFIADANKNGFCGKFKSTDKVREVVRCKDCKYATFYACKNDACYKGIICKYRIAPGDEEFLCSYGERRESTQ